MTFTGESGGKVSEHEGEESLDLESPGMGTVVHV